jgi:hypothetical protein
MKRNRIFALLLIVGVLLLGFFQEQVKIGINFILDNANQLEHWDSKDSTQRLLDLSRYKDEHYRSYDYYYSHSTVSWLSQLSLHQLAQLKWVVTGLSILLHFFAVAAILQLWFKQSIRLISLAVLYLGVIVLSGGVYVLGGWMGYPEPTYAFSRELIGGLQSLVPLMVLAPAIWLRDMAGWNTKH